MIIAIDGPNAAGKTTCIDYLKTELARSVPVVCMDIKSCTQLGNDLKKQMTARHTFDMSDIHTLRLASAHIELIEKAIEIDREMDGVVLLDRTISSFYVYQRCGVSGYENSTELYKRFLAPLEYQIDILYLSASLETITERLKQRGDANHLLDDLASIYYAYSEYFTHIRPADYTLTEHDSLDMIVRTILGDQIKKLENHMVQQNFLGG